MAFGKSFPCNHFHAVSPAYCQQYIASPSFVSLLLQWTSSHKSLTRHLCHRLRFNHHPASSLQMAGRHQRIKNHFESSFSTRNGPVRSFSVGICSPICASVVFRTLMLWQQHWDPTAYSRSFRITSWRRRRGMTRLPQHPLASPHSPTILPPRGSSARLTNSNKMARPFSCESNHR